VLNEQKCESQFEDQRAKIQVESSNSDCESGECVGEKMKKHANVEIIYSKANQISKFSK